MRFKNHLKDLSGKSKTKQKQSVQLAVNLGDIGSLKSWQESVPKKKMNILKHLLVEQEKGNIKKYNRRLIAFF